MYIYVSAAMYIYVSAAVLGAAACVCGGLGYGWVNTVYILQQYAWALGLKYKVCIV